jgi:succinyl-diaminopimelate desuccinylase
MDKALGQGASEIVQKVTLNIGVIRGGLKVNMVPGYCEFEADIRLPVGVEKDQVTREVEKILSRYPQVTMEEISFAPPSWCDPYGEMMSYLKFNVKALRGFEPAPIISTAGTDARLWAVHQRARLCLWSPPASMGCSTSMLTLDFLHVVRTHVLSA